MGNLSVMIASSALLLGCSNGEDATMSLQVEARSVTYDAVTVIPDADLEGLWLGPVAAPYGADRLENVGLHLEITHTNAADLQVWLCYDADNDGFEDARAPVEFYRGKKNGWFQPEPNACPQDLSGHYYFGGEKDDTSPFAVFRGSNAGGSFYIAVVDSMAADTGVIHDWTIRGRSRVW